MRDGVPCTECIDTRTILPAIRHGCYRGSRIATVPLAINVALHRYMGTWQSEVDAFIVFTEFQRNKLIAAGLPSHKIHIKPNFYPGSPDVVPWNVRKNCVVFVGRLTEEKGLRGLLQTWRLLGVSAPQLILIGDGPMRDELELLAVGLPISFMGLLPSVLAQRQIADAKLLVLPSSGFEGFPMVIREAFAFGTPVAVSNIGPLPSIVSDGENGVVFPFADPQSMSDVVLSLWNDTNKLQKMGVAARTEFEQYYTEAANYEQLMRIYDAALREGMRV
jgi:glycosyltransferase involved in cell wall biosynthesis